MKKFLNVLFNLFWVLFVGLIAAISNFAIGVLCCITIVGIPLGLQYFKFVKLVFAPAGKIVVTKYSRHPVMNTFWIVFGGFLTVVLYFTLALLLCVTVVGIPLAKQLFKIMKFMCAPFGSEILKDGEYSKDKNLAYDRKILYRHVFANPEAFVAVEGKAVTTAEYVRLRENEYKKYLEKQRKVKEALKRILPMFTLLLFSVGILIVDPLTVKIASLQPIVMGLAMILLGCAISSLVALIGSLIRKIKDARKEQMDEKQKYFSKIFVPTYLIIICFFRSIFSIFGFPPETLFLTVSIMGLPATIMLLIQWFKKAVGKVTIGTYVFFLAMSIILGGRIFSFEFPVLAVVFIVVFSVKHAIEQKHQKTYFKEHLHHLLAVYPNGTPLASESQGKFEKMLTRVGII